MDSDGGNTVTEDEFTAWLHGGSDLANQVKQKIKDDRWTSANELEAAKRSDLYFLFFLCYPKMSQTWFNHFYCRRVNETLVLLQADYSIECSWEDPVWKHARLLRW